VLWDRGRDAGTQLEAEPVVEYKPPCSLEFWAVGEHPGDKGYGVASGIFIPAEPHVPAPGVSFPGTKFEGMHPRDVF
jgi:hypothetical protein